MKKDLVTPDVLLVKSIYTGEVKSIELKDTDHTRRAKIQNLSIKDVRVMPKRKK